jgi:hypothetical protein
MIPKGVVTDTTEVDDFDAAFNEALSEDTTTPPADEPPADEPPAATPPVAEPPAATPAPAPAVPPATLPEPIQLDLESLFSPVDDAKFEELKLDYPGVAEYLESQRSAEKNRTKQLLDFVQQAVQQGMAPVLAKTQADANAILRSDIEKVHSDATALLPDVEKWIDKLPRHRQIGANSVLDGGSAQDVIELYNEFKKETGRIAPPAAKETKANTSSTQSRLARLEAVDTRRAEFDEPADPNDYEGAFQEALRTPSVA